jgi:glycosyltransferase involved in cell wall biosynthesis
MDSIAPAALAPATAGERPLRILHVFRAPLGGLFRHVLDVARAQIERGHAVGIFCDASTGGERATAILDELAPDLALGVTRITMRRNPHPRDLAALSALSRLYRRERPDVLHGHGSKGGAYARLVRSPELDPAVVRAYTPHGGSFNYQPGTLLHQIYMTAEAAFARRTDILLFESEYVARRYHESVGVAGPLERVVQNGISEAEFEPIERHPEAFDLVYVGELRAAKGVHTLIEALADLRRRGTRLTLLVVGSGPSDEELKSQARTAGVWDSVAFVPPQPIRAALGRGRVMVIPSQAESLPYVILEAAAAAQPLVATRVGGIPEIFGPFADQLIPANDPGRLAAAILDKLQESEAVRAGKAEALAAYVHDRFTLPRMVEGVLDGYRAARAAKGLESRA